MKHTFKTIDQKEFEKTEKLISNISTKARKQFEDELEQKIFYAFQKQDSNPSKFFFMRYVTSKKLIFIALPIVLLIIMTTQTNFVSAKFNQIIQASKKLFLTEEDGGKPIEATNKKIPIETQFIYPTKSKKVTQYFESLRHRGVDIYGEENDPIFATTDGTITFADCGGDDRWNGGYGCTIIIDQGSGIETLYAHNKTNLVSIGDFVEQGKVIATMGATGRATGPHLHFEIHTNNMAVNPLYYLPK